MGIVSFKRVFRFPIPFDTRNIHLFLILLAHSTLKLTAGGGLKDEFTDNLRSAGALSIKFEDKHGRKALYKNISRSLLIKGDIKSKFNDEFYYRELEILEKLRVHNVRKSAAMLVNDTVQTFREGDNIDRILHDYCELMLEQRQRRQF